MIVKVASGDAMDDVKGSMTRDSFLRGEPMRRDKLVKGGAGGFMSAILPSGMRAVAIKIDNSGDSTAGGFILPNDRVDVVRIFRDDEATKARGAEVMAHQTILPMSACWRSARTSRKRTARRSWSAATRRSNSIPLRPN